MDSYHMACGHRAGTPLNFQAIIADYEANNPSRITTAASTATLNQAIALLNAGTIDVIVLSDGIYNLGAYQTPITTVRTLSTIAYIGARNPGKAIVGVDPVNANTGNQWIFSGCQYVYAWMGVTFRNAYRSTSNPFLGLFTDGAKFNRLTGFTLQNCGGASENRIIEIRFGSDDNVINNYVVDRSNGVVIATNAWDAAIRVSGVTRSGSTATYAFTPNSTYPLQTGHVVDVVGFTQPEYNVTDATITLVDSTHFSCTVSGSPVSPGTLAAHDEYSELIYPVANAEVRRTIYRIPQRTICEYGTYMNIVQNQVANNNNNNLLFQDATTRYGYGARPAYSEVRNMWVQNCQTEWQMKSSYSKLHDIINVGPAGGGVSCRAGKYKEMYNIFNPYGGWGFKEDNNTTYNIIAKSFALGEGGPADGTNDGVAQWNTIFAPIFDCSLDHVTLLQGGTHGTLDLFDQDGYGTYVTDVPVSDTTFTDFLLVSSLPQDTTDTNGRTVPGYLTDNNIVFDGFHYYLTNGATASITSANNTSGDPVLEGGVRPTAGSPSSVLSGGVGTVTTDMEGRPFTGRGGLGFTPMDPLYNAGFSGSALVNISDPASFIPTLNELGSNLITPTVSYLLDGSGGAYGAVDFAANIINTNSSEHHIRIVYNAGGSANKVRLWIGTNATLTSGFCIEVFPSGNTVTIYESDGVTLAFPVIPLTLSSSADIGIDGIRTGSHYTWRVNGWPMPTIVKAGSDQFAGWQRGPSVNNGGIVKSFVVETDATSTGGGGSGGGTPSTPETLFLDTFTGSFQNLGTTTPSDVGTGYTLIAETASNSVPMVRQGDGNCRANVASESAYGIYRVGTTGTVTAYTTMRATIGYTNGAPSASAIVMAQHVIDTNNMPVIEWRKNAIRLYFKESGTYTQKGSTYSYSSQIGDYVDFEYTSDDHYKVYLNGNVIIDYDDSSSPTFPSVGEFWLGMGNFVQAGSLLHANFGITDFSITQFVEDPEIPSAAPVFTTTPSIVGSSASSVVASGATDIAGKHYFTVHLESTNYTASDIQDIIDGKAPSGTATAATASDTGVSALELTNLAITDLTGLTSSGKEPPYVKWGYTATASDDTQMITPVVGTYYIPTDVVDANNPAPGEFFRVVISDASTLSDTGFVKLKWPSVASGDVVESPYFTVGGNRIVIDAVTGDMTVETSGQSDLILALNLWDDSAGDWLEDPVTGISHNLDGDVPIVTSGVPNLSGTDLTNATLNYTFIPSQTIGAIGGAVLLEGVTITNSSGNATVNVNNTTPGILIMTDESGGLFIQKVTPTT